MVQNSLSEYQLNLDAWWLSGDSLLLSCALPRAQVCSFLPSFPSFSLPTFSSSLLPLSSHTFPNFLDCTIVITLLDPSAVWPSAFRSASLLRFLSQPPFLDFWILELSTFGHPYHHISTPFSLEPVLRVSFVAFTSHSSPFLTPPSDSRASSSLITSNLSLESTCFLPSATSNDLYTTTTLSN